MSQLANDLAIMGVGRKPEWRRQNASAFQERPKLATDGIDLQVNGGYAVVTLINCGLRADKEFHQSRIRLVTLDDTATYTATIDGTAYNYAASGGDLEADVINGLADAIDVGEDLGVSGINLTFADNDPSADTITRASGDFVADGVLPGHEIVVSGSTSNDATYVVASVATTVLTLEESETLTNEGPASGIDLFLRKVNAVVNTDEDEITVSNLADDETQTHTTAVSSTATGELEFDEDITSADVYLWGYAGAGTNPPNEWGTPLSKDGELGYVEALAQGQVILDRTVSAGVFTRYYFELRSITNPSGDPDDAVAYLRAGPCKLESSG